MSGDTAFVCFGVAPLGNDWLDYPLRAETGCINHLVLLVEELAGAGTRVKILRPVQTQSSIKWAQTVCFHQELYNCR